MKTREPSSFQVMNRYDFVTKNMNILDQFWLNGAILDIHLPSLHGWNFIGRLRKPFPHIPVLAMADIERQGDLGKAIQVRAQDYIVRL